VAEKADQLARRFGLRGAQGENPLEIFRANVGPGDFREPAFGEKLVELGLDDFQIHFRGMSGVVFPPMNSSYTAGSRNGGCCEKL
jgi:hypothetical protein